MMNFPSFFKSGVVAASVALAWCGDRPPDAVGLQAHTDTQKMTILTKWWQVVCAQWIDAITPQVGSLIGHSNITERLGRIRTGDRLGMTKEKNSGDVIIRQGEAVIAILRKDVPHTLESFYGVHPDSYCDDKINRQ